MRPTLQSVICILFAATLAVCAVGAKDTPSHVIVREVLETTAIYQVAATGSMKPTFDENWLLLVQKEDFKTLRIGDVIIYRPPPDVKWEDGLSHELIVHRVWGYSSGHSIILCKGDNVDTIDGVHVTEAMYVGTVVGMVRRPKVQNPE